LERTEKVLGGERVRLFSDMEIGYKSDFIKKVKECLKEKSPQTIPNLCKNTKCKNEFRMMRAVAELQYTKEVELTGFEKIFREDGGAMYLAEYSSKSKK